MFFHQSLQDQFYLLPLQLSYQCYFLQIRSYHHHLYFSDELVDKLKNDFNLTILRWDLNHKKRLELLKNNQIIFCEWAVENAVWYSKNKKPNINESFWGRTTNVQFHFVNNNLILYN